MTLAIFLIIALFIAAIQTAVPFLVKRTVIFGVTIPDLHIKEPQLVSYKKGYAIANSLVALIALGAYAGWALTRQPTEEQLVLIGTLIQFGLIFVSLSLYFYFHAKTMQLKKQKRWTENLKQVKLVDLSVRTRDEMLPWFVFLIPILITVGVLGYTILQYDMLPDQIPTHWNIRGEADAFKEKSMATAIAMPLLLFVMQLMFMGIHATTKLSGIHLSATDKQASQARQLTLRKYTSWFLFLISFLITIMFSIFQLNMIHPDLLSNKLLILAPALFLAVSLLGTLFFAIKVGRSDKTVTAPPDTDKTDYDEDAHWIGGLIYFNKNDPSIFVEKRFGVGWTLNFANPIGYLIILLPLAIILLLAFL